jgi:hypothetical protein
MPSTTVPESEDKRGFVQHVLGLYTSAGREFTAILRKARWWQPLILLVALQVGFTAVWLNKIDKVEFIKAEVERAGRMDRIPVEQRAQVFETQAGMLPMLGWVGALIGAPLLVFVVAGVVCFAALGVAFAHVIPNFESTAAYVNAVFLPVVFLSFYVFDSSSAPQFVRTITDALPLKPLCREECKGLCPSCGADLNKGPCSCKGKKGDPRLAALKKLKDKL